MDAYSEKKSRPRSTDKTRKNMHRTANAFRVLKAACIEENREAQNRIVNCFSTACFAIDADHEITHWNKACEKLTGTPAADAIGTRISGFKAISFCCTTQHVLAGFLLEQNLLKEITAPVPGIIRDPACMRYQKLSHPDVEWLAEVFVPGEADEGKWFRSTATRLKNAAGVVVGVVQAIEDITLLKRNIRLVENEPDAAEHDLLIWRETAALSKKLADCKTEPDDCASMVLETAANITKSQGGVFVSFDKADGRNIVTAAWGEIGEAVRSERAGDDYLSIESLLFVPMVLEDGVAGRMVLFNGKRNSVERDLAALHHLTRLYALALGRSDAKKSREELTEQLRLAQRMDAVGRLAGGIAHDFNNLLTIISTSCSLMLCDINDDNPLFEDIVQIENAAKRAASLTSRLLALSRRQIIEPESLDLNKLIGSTAEMIRKILGAEIEFTIRPAKDLHFCMADRGQIEQVILNLVINARDAMKSCGSISIETADVEVSDEGGFKRMGLPPGKYVMASVSDTGCGMDDDTRKRIFEPFFTTKKEGRGTGLGLSVVYGIIKQHKGHIRVHSEPGKGATFRFYLPRSGVSAKKRSTTTHDIPNVALPRGDETVLVVDDEEPIRKLITRVLEPLGYKVLQASGGKDAVMAVSSHPGPIDLLVTDVVMSGPGGREVANAVKAKHPEIRVLFMSGYSDEDVCARGVFQDEMHFLNKPFSPRVLAFTVRDVIDRDK